MKNGSLLSLLLLVALITAVLLPLPEAVAGWKIEYSDHLIKAMRDAGYVPPPKYYGNYRTKIECNALTKASTGGFNKYGNEAT